MDSDQLGIALACRCGANMSANLAGILFGDRGRVKISGSPVHCQACGAIYRRGERLKYRLLFTNGSAGNHMKVLKH
jgi:hypothetical protein